MTRFDVASLTIEGLLERYAQLSIRQGAAADLVKTSLVNRLGDQIYEISKELKRRPDDRGRALMKLFDHPNVQVRLNAARSLMSVFPEEARQQIQAIANSGSYPQSIDAGLYLSSLDGELSDLLRR
ncbi:enoyl reductase-like protein [Afipia massiliensis]|uniref:Enoyl reductase-like protein n=1 Tax=Afipia massiliensis TaxID=211460 RepID=A0A840MVT6_9BRAD|nr:DUF2019 domain-containing protein [Afipia massiliensis]MBB5050554.1 enoyl reductase-like protein [Afipia massiliensis]